MKKIILTGGGSAGHITPNMAIIKALEERGCEIHYIGKKDSLEKNLITEKNIPFHQINAGKFVRHSISKTIIELPKVIIGLVQAFLLILKLKPAAVFCKGGYVSLPVAYAAALAKVPVIIHESDISLGLANRLCTPVATWICCGFNKTVRSIKSRNASYTGTPIRPELFSGDASIGKELCGFDRLKTKPILLIIGGSLGAKQINDLVRKHLNLILRTHNVCHICGRGNVDVELLETTGYWQTEYVSENLPHLLAFADIVWSRAGATMLTELIALKKKIIAFPLRSDASRGDQIENAKLLEKEGLLKTISEGECTESNIVDILEKSKIQGGITNSGAREENERIIMRILEKILPESPPVL